MVADDAAREADQDRREGDAAFQVRDVPTGRGGGHAQPVRRDPRSDHAVGDSAAGHVTWEQIKAWKTGFLSEKVCADSKIDAEKRSGEPGPTSNPGLLVPEDGKKCQKVRTR